MLMDKKRLVHKSLRSITRTHLKCLSRILSEKKDSRDQALELLRSRNSLKRKLLHRALEALYMAISSIYERQDQLYMVDVI